MKSMLTILKEQPELYDLHTHLLGMGNAGFWLDTILMDENITPKNETFKADNRIIREALCPLVWDKNQQHTGFVNGGKTAEFFHYLVEENIFRSVNAGVTKTVSFEEAIEPLQKKFPPVLYNLITKVLYEDLIHGGLEFKDDFSYDIVLTLSDLGKSLGIKDSNCEGFVQLAVTEKLGGNSCDRSISFQHWIVFNGREQQFKVVYGIQVAELRKLIYVDPNKPSEAAKLARAHIINAFSMCDAEGTHARHIDFQSFHGSFTPDFYPRRFALKDSIYHQRLDVLAALIAHIIERYRTCIPPVTYCELSVSVNDLSKLCVFDVLRSVRIYDQETIKLCEKNPAPDIYKANKDFSSFSQIVLNGHFPYLEVAFKGSKYTNGSLNMPNVMYKFLAGFDRQKIGSPFPIRQDEALNFLYDSPHKGILLMMEEIEKSKNDSNRNDQPTPISATQNEKPKAFDICLEQLKTMKDASKDVSWFYDWVVGLDLVGDELGYPYCPFVARPFIQFVKNQREEGKNKYFGLRIHCGENVKFASDDNPAYRLFIAHMYIVFRCLLFLQQELKYGIRIGHGIAFNHILDEKHMLSRHRKSSVLMAEMRNNSHYLFKKIAFEVNITSNEYLLGQPLRQADYAQILRLKELFAIEAPIVLGTDDDGIWPIDQCSFVHTGHHSLAAEYCRAISTSLIDSETNLKHIFATMKTFCFSDMNDEKQNELVRNASSSSSESPHMNKVIVHPDIINRIDELYKTRGLTKNPAFENYKIYRRASATSQRDLKWENDYGVLRVAFVCICADENGRDKEELRKDFKDLFDVQKKDIKEFDFIYENWQRILRDFVHFKSAKDTKIEWEQSDKKKDHVILSLQSKSEELVKYVKEALAKCENKALVKDEKQVHILKEEINIRAYATDVNINTTMSAFSEPFNGDNIENPATVTVFLFTNTNKYTFAYIKSNGKVSFQINPTPSKRDTKDENFLYVLCEHASAATAALNLISKQLSKFKKDSSTDSFESESPTIIASATVSPANINVESSDMDELQSSESSIGTTTF